MKLRPKSHLMRTGRRSQDVTPRYSVRLDFDLSDVLRDMRALYGRCLERDQVEYWKLGHDVMRTLTENLVALRYEPLLNEDVVDAPVDSEDYDADVVATVENLAIRYKLNGHNGHNGSDEG